MLKNAFLQKKIHLETPPWDLENNNLGGVVASYNLELMIINEPFPNIQSSFTGKWI